MKVHTDFARDVIQPSEADNYARIGAVVALSLGPEHAARLLAVPDAELGKLIKEGVKLCLERAPSLFDVPPPRRETRRVSEPNIGNDPSGRFITSELFDLNAFERKAAHARRRLVNEGKLLPPVAMWEGLGVTRQALNKALSTGRMFTVDVGAEQYYPAFYLAGDLDRRKLERVTQLLGNLPGSSKWQFFTTPKASLDGLTPLIALQRGLYDEVKAAAEAFAER